VRVVQQNARTAADASESVAHLIEAHFFIAQFDHLGLNAFSDGADQGVHRGDGANIAQELDNLAFVLFNFCFNFLNKIHE
jgi:hypothetical protein